LRSGYSAAVERFRAGKEQDASGLPGNLHGDENVHKNQESSTQNRIIDGKTGDKSYVT
jgi:hypothetical protein